jgi:hypothetical protein
MFNVLGQRLLVPTAMLPVACDNPLHQDSYEAIASDDFVAFRRVGFFQIYLCDRVQGSIAKFYWDHVCDRQITPFTLEVSSGSLAESG